MQRGDVYELRPLRRGRGHELRGARYGVVVQAEEFLALSTVVVAPTSTSALPSLVRPGIRVRRKATLVLLDQLRAVDLSRMGDRVGRVSALEQQRIDGSLARFLGLAGTASRIEPGQ